MDSSRWALTVVVRKTRENAKKARNQAREMDMAKKKEESNVCETLVRASNIRLALCTAPCRRADKVLLFSFGC